MATQQLTQVLRWDYVLVYGGGSLLVMVLGNLWCRRVLRQPPLQSVVSVMGMSCPNSGFVGYPIVLTVLPALAGSVLALNMLIENLLVIPVLLLWAEYRQQGSTSWQSVFQTMLRVVRSPLMLGVWTGVLWALTGWTLPMPLARTVDMLAASCAAVSLVGVVA